jgi:hypothetical protein
MEILIYLARQAQDHPINTLFDMISRKLRWVRETDPTRETKYLKNTDSIVEMVEYVLMHYTIALTSTGEIAVVPIQYSAGGHIVHFGNALAPCILRSITGANTFRFIGGTYLKSWTNDPETEHDWESMILE